MLGKTRWCAIAILAAMGSGVCLGQSKPAPGADRKGEEGFRALYTIDRDGSNVRFLAAAPGMICSSSPEWSHNGSFVALDAVPRIGELGDARLFAYAVEGPFKGTFKELGCGNVPSWSPDDRKIAFMVNVGNPCEAKPGIWIMDADGSNREWICPGWYPRWSPDGKRLHVYAYFEQAACIHLVDLKSRKIRKVLGEPMQVEFGGGTWSRDGKRIAFVGVRDGKQHLATVAVDGAWGSIRVLYREENAKRELIGPPAWSPDGKQIVLAIQHTDAPNPKNRRWGNTHLYSLSGEVPSAPARLERDEKGLMNRSPMWSPDSRALIFSSER